MAKVLTLMPNAEIPMNNQEVHHNDNVRTSVSECTDALVVLSAVFTYVTLIRWQNLKDTLPELEKPSVWFR